VPDPNVVTLAPTRRAAALAATQELFTLTVIAGILVGGTVASHSSSHGGLNAPGLSAGIAATVVLYGLLYWRALGIELRIDRAHKTLTVRNFLSTHVVTADQMADIAEGEEVIARGRYSTIRTPCLKIEPAKGGRIWIQASLRNGADKSLAVAVESFCRDNGVRCAFTPADI
jgi:hypothetical protein